MLDDYLERARTEMLPKMKASANCFSIMGDPDPKLCMEIGAAILFDKPIVVIVLKGRTIPLSLRTIAHKIVEVDDLKSPADQEKLTAAIKEVMEAWSFRQGGRA